MAFFSDRQFESSVLECLQTLAEGTVLPDFREAFCIIAVKGLNTLADHAPSRTSAYPPSSSSPAMTNNTLGNYPMLNATRFAYVTSLLLLTNYRHHRRWG